MITASMVYNCHGYSERAGDPVRLLGFNGEFRDGFTDGYVLGQGYRIYNPNLMRFFSPDSFSPFGSGGTNPYTFCAGDPVNRIDPTGHALVFINGRFVRTGRHMVTPLQTAPVSEHLQQRATVFEKPPVQFAAPKHAGIDAISAHPTGAASKQPTGVPDGLVAVKARHITRFVKPHQVADTERLLANHFTLEEINPLLRSAKVEELGPQTRTRLVNAIQEQKVLIPRLRGAAE
jgi:RHS repeat-associated protein